MQDAPLKSYTLYVHAARADEVVTPLFADALVSEAQVRTHSAKHSAKEPVV